MRRKYEEMNKPNRLLEATSCRADSRSAAATTNVIFAHIRRVAVSEPVQRLNYAQATCETTEWLSPRVVVTWGVAAAAAAWTSPLHAGNRDQTHQSSPPKPHRRTGRARRCTHRASVSGLGVGGYMHTSHPVVKCKSGMNHRHSSITHALCTHRVSMQLMPVMGDSPECRLCTRLRWQRISQLLWQWVTGNLPRPWIPE